MGLFNSIRMGASGAVGGYEIDRSVRLDRSATPYFSRTPSSAGNRKTYTISCWLKKSETELNQAIFYAGTSVGTNHNNVDAFLFNGSDQLTFFGEINQSVQYNLTTRRLFRDPSAWFHILLAVDTTQGTSSNRIKLYVNGVQETEFASASYPSQNSDRFVNATNLHVIGYSHSSRVLEGYMAEYYLIDGQALTPASFAETDTVTGEYKPIEYEGTFGTNGFYLNFSDNTNNAAIGTDYSGNSNNYTVNNISSSHDTVPDTPTNNFCTGNYVGRTYTNSAGNTPSYSEGSLEFETAGNSSHAYGTIAVNNFLTSGCYFEVLLNDIDTSRTYAGIVDAQSSDNDASYGFANKAIMRHGSQVYGTTDIDGTHSYNPGISDCVNGDIIGVAIKGTSAWFHINGTYLPNSSGSTGNPSTGANAAITAITDIATKHYLPYAGYNSDLTFNFGQDSTFAGEKTAQGNTDAGGIGDFYYPVPTGFKAICTKNMPDPLIKLPDKHFDILLYDANRTARSLTGLEFQPDFVWIKDRGGSQNHALFDSVRGVNIQLRSDDTGGDATASAPNESLSSFDSNGFSLGTDLGIGDVNYDLEPHVAWNWKGGGSASSNSDGSITSSVSANTTAGFSIVTFTGTGSNATVGHGLGVAPQVFFLKGRNFGDHWRVYHQGTGTSLSDSNRKASKLNTSDGFQTSTSYWNDTSPTSTTVSLGTDQSVNKNTGTFVMYCFSEVEGYSKFGKYVANELSDGPFIYTGFRPAFVILKRRDGNGWYMTDSTRCPYNKPRNYGAYFEANSTSSEMNVETVDLLSNGFKPREASGYFNHQAGSRFIYLAFAESPFKYARAR